MTLSLNFAQAVRAVSAIGSTNSIMLRGAPGMGKTSVGKAVAKLFPDYVFAYIDCAATDLGDLGLPVIDRERMVSEIAPSSRLGLERGSRRPVILLLDELSKSPSKAVMNMLLPLVAERRFGSDTLPDGSMVIVTGNLDTDGVGDVLPAQAYNRMSVVDFANPAAEEWIQWAVQNDVHPSVISFVKNTPEVFARYDHVLRDHPNLSPEKLRAQFPHIFFPTIGQTKTYCSARSLEKASNIMHAADALGDTLVTLLAGTVGEAAARMIEAAYTLDLRNPTTAEILADPLNAPLPPDLGMMYMMAVRLSQQASAKTIERMVDYVLRWSSNEAMSLFATAIGDNSTKLPMALRTSNFRHLAAKVGKFF